MTNFVVPKTKQRSIICLTFRRTSLVEKVNVLHYINTCKDTKGEAAATQASGCIDAIRHEYMVNNFCNASSSCLKRYNFQKLPTFIIAS